MKKNRDFDSVRPAFWRSGALHAMDQRLLPGRIVFKRLATPEAVASAIRDMLLRGAPLIGVAAAYGCALAAKGRGAGPAVESVRKAGRRLLASRPTAVNLAHAVRLMEGAAEELSRSGVRDIFPGLLERAHAYLREDLEANRRMAETGAALLGAGSRVITHCNAGALATSGIGTALGVIRRAFRTGRLSHVFPCETRPYLQGSRLTLWELMREGIPSTLITDNMAAHVMATERIDAVIVGADRIAANGDVCNKIGTYGLSILARHHGIPLFVAAPSTTVDLSLPDGSRIPIEERSSLEVTRIFGRDIAPRGARARHPAFDVTPAELVSAIVTEKGLVRPVGAGRLRSVLQG